MTNTPYNAFIQSNMEACILTLQKDSFHINSKDLKQDNIQEFEIMSFTDHIKAMY